MTTLVALSRQKIVVLSLILCFCLLFIGKNLDESDIFITPKPKFHYQDLKSNKSDEKPKPGVKSVLFYTPFFHMTDWEFGFGQKPFRDFECPVTNCFTTNDRDLLGNVFQFYCATGCLFKREIFEQNAKIFHFHHICIK